MKTFLACALTAALCYIFFTSVLLPVRNEPQRSSATSPLPTITPPAETAETVTTKGLPATIPRRATFQQLSLIRGRVRTISPDGLIVDCELKERRGPAWHLPADAGAADSARLASLSIEQEKKEYGDALYLKNGKLCTGNEPNDKVVGTLLLRDHPDEEKLADGRKIKVIAQSTGELYTFIEQGGHSTRIDVYTMKFVYDDTNDSTDAKHGGWMWQERNNPLQQPAHSRR